MTFSFSLRHHHLVLIGPNSARSTPAAAASAMNSLVDRSLVCPLDLNVVFTTFTAAAVAVRAATILTGDIHARLRLLVPEVVPYRLPLMLPPGIMALRRGQCAELESATRLEFCAHLFVCRNCFDLLNWVLAPKSLVLVAVRRHRWLSSEAVLARRLRRSGRDVLLVDGVWGRPQPNRRFRRLRRIAQEG